MLQQSEAECPASLGWAPGLELNELCYLIGLDLNFLLSLSIWQYEYGSVHNKCAN